MIASVSHEGQTPIEVLRRSLGKDRQEVDSVEGSLR